MEVIKINNLSKQFAKHVVLRNVSLSVNAGELIGYIGPNGAGKSTTIKILCGLMPDFTGTVQVLGMDVTHNTIDIKKRIGYIPENAVLYEVLTPVEYLHFVAQLYHLRGPSIHQKIIDLLALFGLDHARNSRMSTFSKGMKQKVLLISGLLHNPDIIFLDEPLSGLDANAVILVKEILMQLKQSGKTIFYSSHIMDVVEKLSDRIIIINQGQLIADGTFQQLVSQSHSNSLEQIFTQLTGQVEQASIATTFIDVLKS